MSEEIEGVNEVVGPAADVPQDFGSFGKAAFLAGGAQIIDALPDCQIGLISQVARQLLEPVLDLAFVGIEKRLFSHQLTNRQFDQSMVRRPDDLDQQGAEGRQTDPIREIVVPAVLPCPVRVVRQVRPPCLQAFLAGG